jgi:valyl-tRNA synthetase
MLVKALRNLLEPRAVKIETTQDLRSKCLSSDYCGLLLKGSKTVSSNVKQAIQNLMNDYPKITFAAVDTSNLFVRHLEEYLPEYSRGVNRFVVFEKSMDKEKDRLKTSIAPLLDKTVNYSNMKGLVESVVINKSKKTTPIPILPVVKTRTKKLEEEERAKRQRKQAQQTDSGSSSSSTTPGGMFQDNDGSRDGRRAERERRRAEHRANNPNFREKTPEEIQEMERQRRTRMEEEAKKWNMAPEDAPDEGEHVDEGQYVDIDDDDEGEFVDAELDQEDDEDVLDLD